MNSRAKTTSAAPRSSDSGNHGSSSSDERPTLVDRQGFAVGCDDTPIFYRVRGPANAPAIVFCDGIGCDGYVWKYLEAELASHASHRPLALSRPRPHADAARSAARRHRRSRRRSRGGARRRRRRRRERGRRRPLDGRAGLPRDLPPPPRSRAAGSCSCAAATARRYAPSRASARSSRCCRSCASRSIASPGSRRRWSRKLVPTELAYQIATRFEINGELIRRDDFFPYLEHMARVDVRLFLEMLAAAGRHTARELLGARRRADADRRRRSRRLHAGRICRRRCTGSSATRSCTSSPAARTRRRSSGPPRSPSASPIFCARSSSGTPVAP